MTTERIRVYENLQCPECKKLTVTGTIEEFPEDAYFSEDYVCSNCGHEDHR